MSFSVRYDIQQSKANLQVGAICPDLLPPTSFQRIKKKKEKLKEKKEKTEREKKYENYICISFQLASFDMHLLYISKELHTKLQEED